ncbi:MAG TPA: hypothetical protein PKO28_04080 [Bacilli bacterium]|nr:hypothetical protein [Bacilli bacterium]HPS19077.1 hypothetical protein [Bacilli bacterium]
MKQSPHASFKLLSQEVEKIASMYFASKKQVKKMKLYSFSSGDSDFDDPFVLMISRVEKAFSRLDNLDKIFINNDFFHENYPFWWENIYPKCTYYRYKRKAMVNFLKAYDI